MPEFEIIDPEKTLSENVFVSLGAASVCWENMSGAGVFDSSRAKVIGDELVEYILGVIADKDTAIRELDLRRQTQIGLQRDMLTLSQRKLMRVLEIVQHIYESGQLDRFGEIGKVVNATADEVASWA